MTHISLNRYRRLKVELIGGGWGVTKCVTVYNKQIKTKFVEVLIETKLQNNKSLNSIRSIQITVTKMI